MSRMKMYRTLLSTANWFNRIKMISYDNIMTLHENKFNFYNLRIKFKYVLKSINISAFKRILKNNFKIIVACTITAIVSSTMTESEINNNVVKALEISNSELKTNVFNITNDYNDIKNEYDESIHEIDFLNEKYEDLYKEYEDYQKEVGYSKEKIYDIMQKYDYVLTSVPKESDLTLSDLILMDTLSKEVNINPHFVTKIFWNESGYQNTAKNPNSSAIGLGQILRSVGQFTYNELLGKDDKYIHEIHAADATLNVEMTVKLLGYLSELHDGNLWEAVVYYSGGDKKYADKILNNVKKELNLTEVPYYYI